MMHESKDQHIGKAYSKSLGNYYGKRPLVSHSQTNDFGLWFGNKTRCAHVYNIN